MKQFSLQEAKSARWHLNRFWFATRNYTLKTELNVGDKPRLYAQKSLMGLLPPNITTLSMPQTPLFNTLTRLSRPEPLLLLISAVKNLTKNRNNIEIIHTTTGIIFVLQELQEMFSSIEPHSLYPH